LRAGDVTRRHGEATGGGESRDPPSCRADDPALRRAGRAKRSEPRERSEPAKRRAS